MKAIQLERDASLGWKTPLNKALGWNGPGAIFLDPSGAIGTKLQNGTEYCSGKLPPEQETAVKAAVAEMGLVWENWPFSTHGAFGPAQSDAQDYLRAVRG